MIDLVRSELRKMRTARSMLFLALGPVVYGAVEFGPAITLTREALAGVKPSDLLQYGPGPVAWTVFVMVGAMAVAGEFRHRTIVPTLLATPRRSRVVAAKAIATAGVGAMVGAVTGIVTDVLAVVLLRSKGIDAELVSGAAASTIAALAVTVALFAAIGVGLGAVARNQTVAVAGALLWLTIGENVLVLVFREPGLRKWLPTGAARAVVSVADPSPALLAPWSGALLLFAVAAVMCAAGRAVLERVEVA